MISFPKALSLQRIIPAAPARAAFRPLSTLAFWPLRQTTIFPFTFLGSNVPGLHKILQNNQIASWLRVKPGG